MACSKNCRGWFWSYFNCAAKYESRTIWAKTFRFENFGKNYNAFITELNQVKAELSQKMASKTKKSFMIYHPALNYFLKNYVIEEISIEQEGKNVNVNKNREDIFKTLYFLNYLIIKNADIIIIYQIFSFCLVRCSFWKF